MKRFMLAVMFCVASLSVKAVEMEGVKLPDTALLGFQSLVLNGAGVRSKFFVKVYVAALYLPNKQSSAGFIIEDERAHRIALHLLREVSGDKLFRAFYDAIESNHSYEERKAMKPQIEHMKQIFSAVGEVKQGDVITIDYLPSKGVQIGVNGSVLDSIPGKAFDRALLKIWLGKSPAQDDLKKALLGG